MSEGGQTDSCVLDASALLAVLQGEPGADVVEPVLEKAFISSVNWSEVAQKSLVHGVEIDGLREGLEALGLTIVPFHAEAAESTARLRASTSRYGFSLADRACLALSREMGVPSLTTDAAWAALEVPELLVRVIR